MFSTLPDVMGWRALGTESEAEAKVKFKTKPRAENKKASKVEAEVEAVRNVHRKHQDSYDSHAGRYGPRLDATRAKFSQKKVKFSTKIRLVSPAEGL